MTKSFTQLLEYALDAGISANKSFIEQNTRLIDQQLLVRHYRQELKAKPSYIAKQLYMRAQATLLQLKEKSSVQ